jgi:hypothetical protein
MFVALSHIDRGGVKSASASHCGAMNRRSPWSTNGVMPFGYYTLELPGTGIRQIFGNPAVICRITPNASANSKSSGTAR